MLKVMVIEVLWVSAHLAGLVVQSRPRVWKRLRHVGHFF